jgi:hypothetical protein
MGRTMCTHRRTAKTVIVTSSSGQLLVAATDLDVSLTAELKSRNATEGGWVSELESRPRPRLRPRGR